MRRQSDKSNFQGWNRALSMLPRLGIEVGMGSVSFTHNTLD